MRRDSLGWRWFGVYLRIRGPVHDIQVADQGSHIIPELFWEGHLNTSDAFERASRINGVQIKRYLDTYRSSPFGWELDSTWGDIEAAWEDALAGKISTYTFTRRALEICRAMWARFDMVLIVMGAIVLSVGAFSSFTLYSSLAGVDVKPGLGSMESIIVRWSIVNPRGGRKDE